MSSSEHPVRDGRRLLLKTPMAFIASPPAIKGLGKALGPALIAPVAGVVSGCGFKLRGTSNLSFSTLYTTFGAGSTVGTELQRELARSTTTKIVPKAEGADVRLYILGESRERDILAYTVVGAISLYELRLRLQFRAADRNERELLPGSQILVRREVSASTNQLIARGDEEALLYRDMERDVVQQLLQRLSAIRDV